MASWGSTEIVNRFSASSTSSKVRPRRSNAWPDALLAGELGDDRAQPAPGGDQPERGGDGRLADAPLAGDEDQATVKEPGHGPRT